MKLVMMVLFFTSISAHAANSIQCRDFFSEVNIEILLDDNDVWNGETSIPVSIYNENPQSFVPTMDKVALFKSRYRFFSERITVESSSPEQIQSIQLLDNHDVHGNKTLDLVFELDAKGDRFDSSVLFRIENYFTVYSDSIILTSDAGMYYEHGGFLHGYIGHEPVFCALDSEGSIEKLFVL